jgi:hypothetical protein
LLYRSIKIIMKKVISLAALLLIGSAAQAQVHFDSGSAKPKNPRAMQFNERQLHEAEQARKRRVLVRCKDGSKHIARVCRRHGGVA